jgi:hypothetical protein
VAPPLHDLRGSCPGIYMATLDATGPSVYRKFIITAHQDLPRPTPGRADRPTPWR